MKNCSGHADLFVRLFARAIISEIPPTLSVKISTLYHNILTGYLDSSHMVSQYLLIHSKGKNEGDIRQKHKIGFFMTPV